MDKIPENLFIAKRYDGSMTLVEIKDINNPTVDLYKILLNTTVEKIYCPTVEISKKINEWMKQKNENKIELSYNEDKGLDILGLPFTEIEDLSEEDVICKGPLPRSISVVCNKKLYNDENLKNGFQIDENGTLLKYFGTNKNPVVPDCVKKIGHEAFYDSHIESVTISDNTTEIEYAAFMNCESLKGVSFGKNLIRIGEAAFLGCKSLDEINIQKSIRVIKPKAFACCGSLKISVNKDNDFYSSIDGALYNKNKTTLIRAPETSVKKFVIPDTVKHIEESAFCDYESITDLVIPNSLKSMGFRPFVKCSNLKAVHISNLTDWCNIDTKDNPLKMAGDLYLNGVLIKELVIPEDVAEIKEYAFCGSSITKAEIPMSVTKINQGAFYGCKSLESVTIKAELESISESAFYGGCDKLKEIRVCSERMKYLLEDSGAVDHLLKRGCNIVIDTSLNPMLGAKILENSEEFDCDNCNVQELKEDILENIQNGHEKI